MVRVEITDLTEPEQNQVLSAPRAHSSSTDQNEKSHNLQKSSSAVQWYRKGGFSYMSFVLRIAHDKRFIIH